MEFTLEITPPTVTAQEHKIRIVYGRPMFYDTQKGYRYTLDAIILPIGREAGLCFCIQQAMISFPMRNPA